MSKEHLLPIESFLSELSFRRLKKIIAATTIAMANNNKTLPTVIPIIIGILFDSIRE